MLRRPKCSETEADLLALQESFLSSQTPCSTRLVTTNVKETNDTGRTSSEDTTNKDIITPSPLDITNNINKYRQVVNNSKDEPGPDKDVVQRMVIADTVREVSSLKEDVPCISPHYNQHGFPSTFKLLSIKQTQAANDTRKSLFAQQFDSNNPNSDYSLKENTNKIGAVRFAGTSSVAWDGLMKSDLITGDGLVTAGATPSQANDELVRINTENEKIISSMSQREILEEQKKLKESLSPQLQSFLKLRNRTTPLVKCNESSMEDNMHVVNDTSNDVSQRWLHMDETEHDKLQWTKDVTISNTNTPEIYKEIRFSFDGRVIPREVGVTIPSHAGLHHHGDQPESAGYTLYELFTLSRSSISQQLVLGIHTLSSIIRRARNDEYNGLIEGSPLTIIIESGYPQLLRYALYRSIESIQAIAIYGIHSLIISPHEEELLSVYSNCRYRHLPCLVPPPSSDVSSDVGEVMSHDVVKGLLGMMLLPRLRYILEVCHPQTAVVTNVMEILIRISRHSLQAANEIIKCPRLIQFIVDVFLPLTWIDTSDDIIYDKPHPLAMKLMYYLCKAGRYITKELLSSYQLLTRVLKHVVMVTDDHTHTDDGTRLVAIESVKTWDVLLGYGETTDTLINMLPSVMEAFKSYVSPCTSHILALQWKAAIFQLFSSVIICAGVLPIGSSRPPLSVRWFHVRGVVDSTLKCLSLVLNETQAIISNDTLTLDGLQYISALFSIISVFYGQCYKKPELRGEPVALSQDVETLSNDLIISFYNTKLYLLLLTRAKDLLKQPFHLSNSFPFLSSHLPLSSPVPAVYSPSSNEDYSSSSLSHLHCSLVVYTDLLHVSQDLCLSLVGLHRGIYEKIMLAVTRNDEFWLLMEQFINILPSINTNISFIQLHSYMLSAVKFLLVSDVVTLSDHQISVIHSVSLGLVSLTPPGHESSLHDLISNVIFHPTLFRVAPLENAIVPPPIVGVASPIATPTSIGTDILTQLPVIKQCYVEFCGPKEANIQRSRYWQSPDPVKQDTMLLPSINIPLASWPHLPLITLSNSVVDESCDHVNIICCSCLSLLLFLEYHRPSFMKVTPTTQRFISTVRSFLIHPVVFFESAIREYLSSFLMFYSQPSINTSLDFSSPSFNEFYSSILDQFSSVSYGDQLFALFLLFPLQQRHLVSLRKLFWIDYTHILKLITLTPQQCTVSLESFLFPLESDVTLLDQYLKVLASDDITKSRNPFLYIIAIHHLHGVITDRHEDDRDAMVSKRFLDATNLLPNKDLQGEILLYQLDQMAAGEEI